MTERKVSKAQRQQAISDLLANEAVTSQEQIVDHLSADGIPATQATVSRDTGLIWRQQQPLPPLAVELVSHLRACLREAGDDLYSSTAAHKTGT